MTWRFFLYNWAGEAIGEIVNASQRRLNFGLNKNPTLSFQLSLDNELAENLIEFDDHIVVAYRLNPATGDWTCQFSGPIITKEQVAGDDGQGSFAIAAAGPWWRMGKRIANNAAGDGKKQQPWTLGATMEAGSIASLLIRNSNEVDGNSWLRASVLDQQIGTPVIENFQVGSFRPIATVVEELAGGDTVGGGFDWYIEPKISFDNTGLCLGKFRCGPSVGRDLTETVVFEYGTGRHNLNEFKAKSSIEFLLNKADHLDTNDGAPTYSVTRQDAQSISQIGIWEETVTAPEITDPDLRRQLLDAHVSVRSNPRQLIEVTPARSDTGTAPIPLIDYRLGDTVGVRAFYSERLWLANADGSPLGVRVYDINIELDDGGVEQADLGLYLS